MSTGIIYAMKATGALATFDALMWKEMGNNRNGWQAITKSQYEAAAAGKNIAVKTNTDGAAAQIEKQRADNAEKLRLSAEGFEKDGKIDEALAKYVEAKAAKASPIILAKIKELTAAIAERDKGNGEGTTKVPEAMKSKAGSKVNADSKKPKAPTPKQLEEFKTLVKSGDEARAAEDHALALEHYETAAAIKSTAGLQKRIEETRAKIA